MEGKKPNILKKILSAEHSFIFLFFQMLSESAICNDYLDEVYPDEKLNPTDPYEKAKQRILLERWGKVMTKSSFPEY